VKMLLVKYLILLIGEWRLLLWLISVQYHLSHKSFVVVVDKLLIMLINEFILISTCSSSCSSNIF